MIRYGPVLCIILLMISAFYLKRIKDLKRIHQLIVSVFMLSFFLMFFYFFNYGQTELILPLIGRLQMSKGTMLILLVFYLTILLIVWFSYYALSVYIPNEQIPIYYRSFLIMIAALTLLIISQNMIVMFLAYLGVLLTTFIMMRIRNKDSKKREFLLINGIGLIFLFIGLMMMILQSQTVDLSYFNSHLFLNMKGNLNFYTLSLTLCVLGLGIFGLLFPFFSWMPNLFYKTPSTLSALLSGITVKAAPLFLMKIILTGYGSIGMQRLHVDTILVFLGVGGMISGSLIAIRQTDLKKILAYSTVSQLGYIYLALGLGNQYGMAIAIYQLMAHTLTKVALYLATSSIYEQVGTTDTDALRGIGKEMPITLTCFAICALSMVGIPLFPGFITKWNILLGSLQMGSIVPLIAVLISSLLNASYYFPIIINGFYGKRNVDNKVFASKVKPFKEIVPMMILVVGVIGFGIFSNRILFFIELLNVRGGV